MSTRNYTNIWAYELALGDVIRPHTDRSVVEFLEAKSSEFIKVRWSDGAVRTYDRAEVLPKVVI